MKRFFLQMALAASAFLLVNCTAPIQRRIEKNPQIFSALSESHKAKVQHGEVEEGMSTEAVFLAWGKPDRASKGTKLGKTYERWSYTGYDAVQSQSFGIGYGYGYSRPHGRFERDTFYAPMIYPETTVDYVPFEAARVEFTGGKVSAWSVAK
jgi:hypothetical protein